MKKKAIIIGIEIIIIIALYMFINSKYIELVPKCWVHRKIGFLCPACGGTRCVINIFKGNITQAFFSHMIFFISIVYIIIVNIIYIINIGKKKKILTWIYPKYWYAIIFAIVLIIYTIVRNLL